MLPKLVLTDVDGVLTDGGMYYDQKDNEWKKFNTTDSFGVALCNAMGIEVVFITGEDTKIVERRAKKLKVKYLIQGSRNKLSDAEKLCSKLKLKLKELAYIGDDYIDLNLLQQVGFSGTPANAPAYIKDKVDFVTNRSGGEGAFREFVEEIFRREGILDSTIQKILIEKYSSK
jgi:YrbI family 3-deoxy-D-manno-octulosonate 8-phosphate phosphatase